MNLVHPKPGIFEGGRMSNFYIDIIQKDPRFHSTKHVFDLALLEPVTRAAVMAIIAEAKAQGHNLMVFETYRSQELQQIYFRRKVTRLQKVGVHHYGLAADIVKVVHGEPSWDGSFDFMRDLAEKHNLIWGGNWGEPDQPYSFRDPVHVQRVTVADQAALFRGEWYPDEKYSPYEEA